MGYIVHGVSKRQTQLSDFISLVENSSNIGDQQLALLSICLMAHSHCEIKLLIPRENAHECVQGKQPHKIASLQKVVSQLCTLKQKANCDRRGDHLERERPKCSFYFFFSFVLLYFPGFL